MVDKTDRSPRDRYVDGLEIDEDDLDRCLVEQPGLFFHVAKNVALANSRRDGAKLELKELCAEIDQEIRETALRLKEKTREDSIKNQITLNAEVMKLERRLLDLTAEAERAQALKEAYQQRSYALKDMVSLELSNRYNLGVERGAVSARNRMADRIEQRLSEQRQERRRTSG